MSQEQLANASREELLEHIAIQREVIHRLNRKLMDMEATLDYLATQGSERREYDGPYGSDEFPQPLHSLRESDSMPPRHRTPPPPAGVSASDHRHGQWIHKDPTTYRQSPSPGKPIPSRRTSTNVSGLSLAESEEETAVEKIDAVLAAHRSASPSLPADVVAELLYIRDQLTASSGEASAKQRKRLLSVEAQRSVQQPHFPTQASTPKESLPISRLSANAQEERRAGGILPREEAPREARGHIPVAPDARAPTARRRASSPRAGSYTLPAHPAADAPALTTSRTPSDRDRRENGGATSMRNPALGVGESMRAALRTSLARSSRTPLRTSGLGPATVSDVKWVSPKATRIVYGPEITEHAGPSSSAAGGSGRGLSTHRDGVVSSRRSSLDVVRDVFGNDARRGHSASVGRTPLVLQTNSGLSPIPRAEEGRGAQTPLSFPSFMSATTEKHTHAMRR